MSEEELVIFDIRTRPAPELSDAERAEVKKVVREPPRVLLGYACAFGGKVDQNDRTLFKRFA